MRLLQKMLVLCILIGACTMLAADAVAQPCCVGRVGDANSSGEDMPTIGDISVMIDAKYITNSCDGLLLCLSEADINQSGLENPICNDITIGDISYLIDYLYITGPELGTLPDCLGNDDDAVFIDEYASGVTYEAFAGSKLDGVAITTENMYAGSQGLEVTIPGADPWWTGGACTDSTARDLTGFNALTFWAKSSQAATIDAIGIGDDNTGTSKHKAEVVGGMPVTTGWQKYVIPFPLASKLTAERGLFFFAEGFEGAAPYLISIDEIIFEDLATISTTSAAIVTETLNVGVGDPVNPSNGTVVFDIDGSSLTMSVMAGYFTFLSSDPGVVEVGLDGALSAVGEGTATLTADLGALGATGTLTVNVTAPVAEPAGPAPTPTQDPGDVISIFSDAYTDIAIDTYNSIYGSANIEDYVIGGTDNTKKYTNLAFAIIEFTSVTQNVTAMTHFHVDVWTPDNTESPNVFKVKLVDFGANGVWDGPGFDDVEHELTFDQTTMNTGEWVSIDVPMTSFAGLTTKEHLAQVIISGDPNTVYVDNMYLYDAGLPTSPPVSAPTPPSRDPGDVISVFCDEYTDIAMTTWSFEWDHMGYTDETIGSDNLKKFTFGGEMWGILEYAANHDGSAMTHFHIDLWTADETADPNVFKVKAVDYGPDGVYGGVDDSFYEETLDHNTMVTGSWVSVDIDLSSLTERANLRQLVLSGTLSTVFVDNMYFYNAGAPLVPTTPAPTPTYDAGNVISIFSDAYTDIAMTTYSWEWDHAGVTDEVIGSDNVKKYTFGGDMYGILEYAANQDGSAMTHFHIDLWTPDNTDAPNVFKVKVVDYGPDGAYDGGDDSFYEPVLDENTMNTGGWVSVDIDLSSLTERAHLRQLVLSGTLATVWVDNMFFYSNVPLTEAPTPIQAPGNVISVFSDAYTDIAMTTYSFEWDHAGVTDEVIGADNVKKYTFGGDMYGVLEYAANQDGSTMTHFHIDLWTPDATVDPNIFKVKVVDFGPNGVYDAAGDDTFLEPILDHNTMTTGSWVSVDIDLSSLTERAHLRQLVLSGTLATVWVDNMFFYDGSK